MDINNLTAKMSLEDDASPAKSRKREGCLKWEEFFMANAVLAAQRSKDPECQVGACIVNPAKRIVGVGYNGMPNGCSDDIFEWKKDLKQLYVCHAEMNAILNKNVIDVKGCDLYVTRFPCNECAKVIIQSGISTIYFLEDKHPERQMYVAAKKMFVAAGVAVRQFTTDRKENIEIRLRISPKPQPEPQSESQPESQAEAQP